MNVTNIHIHPNYANGSGYDNIAILSLEHLLDVRKVQPVCLWHEQDIPFNEVHVFGNGRKDMNSFPGLPRLDPTIALLKSRLAVQNSSTCVIPNLYESRLKNGMQKEHVCIGEDFFLVPKSCDLLIGGPIAGTVRRADSVYPAVFGLVQFGRDCGFGEHAVATGFANHIEWMKSVLNNTEKKSMIKFLDNDLHEGDECINFDSEKAGLCVAVSKCPRKWKQFLSTGSVQFCSSTSVICCPLDAIGSESNIHQDLVACPDVVRKVKPSWFGGSLVYIGWIEKDISTLKCLGSIITKRVILTTASCLGEIVPDFVKQISNATNFLYKVNTTFKHHFYNPTDNSNDIGLVKLTDEFKWTPYLYPSCLWMNKTHTSLVMDILYPPQGQDSASLLMLSNERLTLDDCHLRFHKLVYSPLPKPAFGHPARLKEFAHIGAIGWTQSDGTISWNCGGTLIWDNFVLTAAHCAVDFNNKRPDVIRFGDLNIYSSDDDEYAQQLKIIDVIRHPKHRYAAQYHDIALMKLEKNVALHETVAPACLWTDEEIRFRSLEAAGWGKTGFAEAQTPVLLKITLKPMNNEECGKIYMNDTNRRLRLGLQDHHICAVDEKMDTCEGDSGGPLQIKLMHNGRVTPFLVGVTSFGTVCGTSSPGVYTKVSSYHDWIIETMRTLGGNVSESTFNATFCALRYVHLREYEDAVITSRTDSYVSADSSLRHMKAADKLPSYVVKLSWGSGGRDNCYGAIIDETTVLTLAECVFHNGAPVDHIVYLEDKKMNVTKYHIHPEYTEGSGYNNIAILSLEHLLDVHQIQPACFWHEQELPKNEVHIFGKGREDINTFWPGNPLIDPTITLLRPRLAVHNSSSCAIPDLYKPRLQTGLKRELVCTGKDFFLVPKSCDLLVGGPIDETMWRVSNTYPTIFGLVQFGRDCGFGEHTVATGFADHLDWMKSVILANHTEGNSALQFLDHELHEGDACVDDNKSGFCVAVSGCPRQWRQFLSTRRIQFCSSTSVICCPLDAIESTYDIHPDLVACPNVVRNMKSKMTTGSLVHIGWVEDDNSLTFKCIGSIITKSIILTTASCLGEIVPDVVKLISNDTNSYYQINATLTHYAYNATDNSNDIGLVRLRDEFKWSSDVYPSCLWTNNTHTPLILDMVFPSGPVDVFYRRVLAMYNSDCQRTNAYQLTESQLCVRDPRDKSTCPGLPSILHWQRDDGVIFAVGLSTVLPDCDERYYMIYTRFSAYSQWISNILQKLN
ncbi:uncharacterized protein LOC129730773 isoform X2 [Wyeomyia smithii]|nr:uncharacterized protein LOC129730773 isoform X2 [Wyeomyia smithii]XP_055546315.1 uncharacterized protein LOC129730773 isoform X2 [Wyeomyia smithii]